jgi:hypothetical protein
MPNWKLTIAGEIFEVGPANPAPVTTSYPHGLVTGDSVVIAGTACSPTIDGTRTVTVTSATTFTVPVNVTLGAVHAPNVASFFGGDQRVFVLADSSNIDMPLNERHTMRFRMVGQIPFLLGPVAAYAQDGTTKLFGGIITNRRAVTQAARSHAFFTDVVCGDYSTYADHSYQTKNYTVGPTLEAVLDDLVADKLTSYGIAVHGSQVTGPTLEPFEWASKRISECLRELSEKTGYFWRIDADKKLRMQVPGTDAAPYTVTQATPNIEDIEWDDPTSIAPNKVTLRCGPDGVDEVTQTWIQAGAATSWVADIPAASGYPSPGYVTVNGVYKTVDSIAGAQYLWNDDTSTLSLGTDSTPTNGWAIVLIYNAQFPFTVSATTGATPVIETIVPRQDIKQFAAAEELVEGLLDQLSVSARTMRMPSTNIGWLPGQALNLNLQAVRNIEDSDATVTHVGIQMTSDDFWRYTITAQETTVPQGGDLAQWRHLMGRTSGGGGSASGLATLPGPTVRSSVVSGGQPHPSYPFTRPSGRETGGTGDICGTWFQQAGGPQYLFLENTAVGGATFSVDARTGMIARGWSDAGAGAQSPLAQVLLVSDTTQSYGTLTAQDSWTFTATALAMVGRVDLQGRLMATSVISPTQLVADTHNWNPTNLATALIVRIDVDAARSITGIVAQTSGTMLLLYNTTAFDITLPHDSGSSTAANRIYGPNAVSYTLGPKASAWIRYDGTHSRWTVI